LIPSIADIQTTTMKKIHSILFVFLFALAIGGCKSNTG
jgi:hypothetical protein